MNGLPIKQVAAKDDQATWVRWRMVGLVMAFSFMNHFNRVSISAAHDALQTDFGFTSTQIGNIATAFLFVYTLFMTPGGWLIDRVGPRAALAIMGFGSAIFGAMTSLAGPVFLPTLFMLPSFFLIRGLMGATTAPLHPSGARVVSYWIPFSRQALANGLITGAAPVGIACAPLVFGKLLVDAHGWRAAFVITGICTAMLAVLWTIYAKDRPSQHSSVNVSERDLIEKEKPSQLADGVRPAATFPWYHLLKNRSLLLLTISYGTVGYFEYLLFYWMEQYFKQGLKLETDQSRVFATIPPLAMVATMPLGGWISDCLVPRFGPRLGRSVVPVVAMIASAVFLLGASFARDPYLSLVLFTLASGAIGAAEGPFWTTAIELGGRRGGTSAGICNTGGNAGGVLTPSLTPYAAALLQSWQVAMALGSAVCLAGVVLWFWIDPRERVEDNGL